jgi:hypothetical protein
VRGEWKRLAFLFGLVTLFAGAILLIDPMAVEDRNCGSALMRRTVEHRYSERCDAKLDHRRLPGFGLTALGICAVVAIGPRCLLQPD